MGYDSSDFGTTFKIDGDKFIISISKEGQDILAELGEDRADISIFYDIVSDAFHEKHSVVTNLEANGWFGLVDDNYMLFITDYSPFEEHGDFNPSAVVIYLDKNKRTENFTKIIVQY